MLPLVKKGYWVEYKMGRETYIHKCFQSNPTTVWVEDEKGRVVKLHKLRNFIKVVEEPKVDGRKEEKPKKPLDNLFDDLLSTSRST